MSEVETDNSLALLMSLRDISSSQEDLMAEDETEDPFAYMLELCHISSSQEEILGTRPFVGETATETGQDAGKGCIFNPPSEQQLSLPTGSDKQRPEEFQHCALNKMVQFDEKIHGFADYPEEEYVDLSDDLGLGFPQLKSGKAEVVVDLSDDSESGLPQPKLGEAAEIVDLSDDSELGSPQLKLEKKVDGVFVAECSQGGDGVSVGEIFSCEIDRFRLSKRELSSKDNLVDSPLKKMKHGEQNPGFESSQDCLEIEPQKIGEDTGNHEPKLTSNTKSPCNFEADPQSQQKVQVGKEMRLGRENACGGSPFDKNLGSQSEIARNAEKINLLDIEECDENSKSREGNLEAKKLPCTGERNKSMDEVAETSENHRRADKQPELPLLASSVLEALQNAAREGKNSFVFDVLKALKENTEDVDWLENACWEKLAEIRGFALPRPRWKKEKDNNKN